MIFVRLFDSPNHVTRLSSRNSQQLDREAYRATLFKGANHHEHSPQFEICKIR